MHLQTHVGVSIHLLALPLQTGPEVMHTTDTLRGKKSNLHNVHLRMSYQR